MKRQIKFTVDQVETTVDYVDIDGLELSEINVDGKQIFRQPYVFVPDGDNPSLNWLTVNGFKPGYSDANIRRLNIPERYKGEYVARIGDSAFANLEIYELNCNSLYTIGEKAFYQSGLSSINSGTNRVEWKRLGAQALDGCKLPYVILGAEYTPLDIGEGALSNSGVHYIFYCASVWHWTNYVKNNDAGIADKVYFYSEKEPSVVGKYWHYNEKGMPKLWFSECDINGHTPVLQETKEPTCSEAGWNQYSCLACGEEYTEEIPATGDHEWGEETVTLEPTCVAPGEANHTCINCAHSEKYEVPATGVHKYGDWTITLEPTCSEPGEETGYCEHCTETDTREVPATGDHIWSEWEVNVMTDLISRQCLHCGAVEEALEFTLLDDESGYEVSSAFGVLETDEMPSEINIPGAYSNTPVRKIADYAFEHHETLKNVTLPDSDCLTTIGKYAFHNSGIETMHIPDSVVNINSSAFNGCSNLTEVTYGEESNLLYMGYDPDGGGAESPSSAKYLYVSYPNGVVSSPYVWEGTFPDQTQISGGTLYVGAIRPDGTKESPSEFYNYVKIEIKPNTNYNMPFGVFYAFKDENDSFISGGNLGHSVFAGCYNMRDITIPNKVVYIGGCNIVEGLTDKPNIVESISGGSDAYSCEGNCLVENATGTILLGCNNSVIPDGVKIVDNFRGCQEIKHVTIPASVTHINAYAFRNCINLETVTFEEGSQLVKIGSFAFENCKKLKTIEIPEGCTEIAASAFVGCDALETVEIPSTVSAMGSGVFPSKTTLTIRVKMAMQPIGWAKDWCEISVVNVVWGYSDCADGHTYTAVVTPPTCTEQGYTTYTCSVCGESYVDSYTDALGHNYGEWTITLEPTCIEIGTRRADCTRCDHYKTETVEALGHIYSTVKVGATCVEQGYDLHTCSRCGHSYKDNYTEATGKHTYGEWVTITEAGCSTDGLKRKTCSVCGATLDEVIPATGNHTWSEWITTSKPTCTANGTQTRTCDCGITQSQPLVSLGHFWAAATCTAPKTCSVCGATEGEALGHTWGDWKEITPAVCGSEGQEERTCSVCGEVETRVIPALIHDYVDSIVEPDCDDGGYTLHTCSRCGHTYQDNYTDPTNLHNWGDWIIDIEPTCFSEGSKTCTCKDCGYLESADIPMTDHTPSDWIIDKQPTTEEEGSQHQECTVCGKVLGTFPIPKLEDTNTYLVTESGEYLTDEEGNLLIL